MPLPNQTFRDAKWIVPEGAKTSVDANRTAFFRLDFTLPDPLPADAALRLCVTAHTRYKLRVNDVPIAVGPRKGNAFQHFFERLEIREALRPGGNAVILQVVAYAPFANPGNEGLSPLSVLTNAIEPLLLAAGGVYCGGEQVADATSGVAPWRACTADGGFRWLHHPQTHYVGAFERRVAAEVPRGILAAENADWSPARVWSPQNEVNPWGELPPLPLCERTIPLMYEREHGFTRQMPCENSLTLAGLDESVATEIPAGATCALELDAGELTTGYTLLRVRGGKGAAVRVRYAESYQRRNEDGRVVKGVRDDPASGDLLTAFDEILPDGGECAFEPFWFRAFRFVRIEIETAGEPLTLYAPRYRRTGYPLEVTAAATSKAEWVKELFDISVRTLRCCMHETHEDCPFYEQLQYISDTKLQMDFTYAISGDLRMARQVIEDYHRSLMPDGMLQSRSPSQYRQAIPQFALYWIHMLDALYEQDADAEFVSRYRPTMDAVLDYFDRHRDENGLVKDLGYWDFADWVPAWPVGVPPAVRMGPSTVHNLAYAWTLKAAARLTRLTGREQVAEEYAWRADDVIAAVMRHCFDEKTGMFRDGPECADISQHAQVFGVLSGALGGDAARKALRGVLAAQGAAKCSYPQQFYLLRALEEAGLYDLADDAVWRGLIDLLPLHITTLPETPGEPRSDCHAWSALPLYDIPRTWLGVRPERPGWRGILVKPLFPPMLDDLQGFVPTPHGPVAVAWARADGAVTLAVQSPDGVPLTVITPDGRTSSHPNGGGAQIVVTG